MTKTDTIYQNRKPNRLANEKSPYLLQHAYYPVNWYPWGEEAFEKATDENKQSSFQSAILVVIGVMSIKDTTY